jgi:hypothetical protein
MKLFVSVMFLSMLGLVSAGRVSVAEEAARQYVMQVEGMT